MYCQVCGSLENLTVLRTVYIKEKKYVYYICRACNTERRRKYYATPTGKKLIKLHIAKYEARHPERREAWNRARDIQLKPCEICGVQKTHRHHPDPAKPLFVVFLCPVHHSQAHSMVQ